MLGAVRLEGVGSLVTAGGGVSFIFAGGISFAEGISFIEGPLAGLVSSVPAQPLTISTVAKIDIIRVRRISMPTSFRGDTIENYMTYDNRCVPYVLPAVFSSSCFKGICVSKSDRA